MKKRKSGKIEMRWKLKRSTRKGEKNQNTTFNQIEELRPKKFSVIREKS